MDGHGKGERDEGRAYTVGSGLRCTTLRADPEVSRSGIHEELEITGRGAHLDSRNIAHIISLDIEPK
jgi:hypothetical protein